MSYSCYNMTLGVIECVNERERAKHPAAILYEEKNKGHKRFLQRNDILLPCKHMPTDSRGRSEHYAIITKPTSKGISSGISDLHELAVEILHKTLSEKRCSILLSADNGYDCEFDAICTNPCTMRLKPAIVKQELWKYKVAPIKTHSMLFPSRTPDILLYDVESGSEIWFEIRHSHEQTKDQKRLFLGIPIAEIDCIDLADLQFLQYTTFKTHLPSRYNDSQYGNKHFRVFNPWNLPVYKDVIIPCNIYIKDHDLRPNVRRTKKVKNHYFVLPDGMRIKGELGIYNQFYPLNKNGQRMSRKSLTDFKELDIEEVVEYYSIDYDKIRRKNEEMGH